jgi:muramoyltetrapeptide carboxypeptidase
MLKQFGLNVEVYPSAFSDDFHPFSGKDQDRLADLQKALDSPNIKAIFCTRGGYGLTRIIEKVSWAGFIQHPKWVVGFSDITVLLADIQKLGYQAIHGPVLKQWQNHLGSVDTLHKLLVGEAAPITWKLTHSKNGVANGNFKGVMTGGNLSMIQTCIGTKLQLSNAGKIIFVEEVGEHQYKVDRMVRHLAAAGYFSGCKAVLLGDFSHPAGDGFPQKLEETLVDIVGAVPILSGFHAGHIVDNYPIVFGREATVSVEGHSATLRYS